MVGIADMLPLLIPIIAVSIPLVVVTGRFVVQPIVEALSKLNESQRAHPDQEAIRSQMTALERRLDSLETVLHRLDAEQQFRRELESGAARDVQRRSQSG